MIIIGPEAEAHLDWAGLTAALAHGHLLPRAGIADTFLYRGGDTLLNRAAWIDGLGLAVKSATIFPDNPKAGLPGVNGAMTLFDDTRGQAQAMIDFHLVTRWKTAGDSLLSAQRLARPDARAILLVGAGAVARAMVSAYSSVFAGAAFSVWNRSRAGAEAMAAALPLVSVADDLETAVRGADIIATCTMATSPLIEGRWLAPGTHLDLIGAYRPDMREVDDETLRRARIFVDSRATAIAHIGELADPIARGVMSEADVIADFYDPPETFVRRSADEITLAKNGGGAHLDLMTARYILDAVRGG